jgi:hypothetical protein
MTRVAAIVVILALQSKTWWDNGRRGAPSSTGIDGIERRWFCPLADDRPQKSV